jgi:hypothetical protein
LSSRCNKIALTVTDAGFDFVKIVQLSCKNHPLQNS